MFALIRKRLFSIIKINDKNKFKYESIKICLIYLMIGIFWICISDGITYKISNNLKMQFYINTYKGLLYVTLTSIILYFLISNFLKKVNSAYDKIIESEKKLSKSEEKSRAIIKALPDLLFIINYEGRFIDCEASDENLLLVPKKTFIGKTLWEVLPEEIAETGYEKIQLALKSGELQSFEYKLKISGKEDYYELRIVKSGSEEVLAISRNVTFHRQNELELKISEEKYKNLVNQMLQGLALHEVVLNADGEVTDYIFLDTNESYERLTGLNKKDIIGKTVLQVMPNTEKYWIEKYGHVAKTGEPVHFENYSQELGKYYEVVAYRPKPLQFAVIITDITERKQAEEAVKASEYNFRRLFESSADAILIFEDDIIADCNPAAVELLAYDSKANIIGKTPWEISPVKQPDGTLSKEKTDSIYETTRKNIKSKYEWWYQKSDGTLLPVEIMLTSIRLNGKKVFHGLCRDVSDRKQMEQKLEYLSYHDQLTGLYNRRFFEEELKRLNVPRNFPLTIIMADVNGLKLINDSFGHAVGDKLLKKVAEVMAKGCRADDIIARLGGDEFIILLPKTDEDQTEQIVKRIKAAALVEKIDSIDISVSFGWESKNNDQVEIQEVFKKAEDHMYKKKLFESPSMRGKTIKAIINTLHEKNKREEQHSHRVSELSKRMGKALGLNEAEVEELKTIGLLHDIGKIAIEENILNKAGKLTESEWEEIKRHPEIGYRILSTLNDMSEMAEYVLAHHERWDGMGYPKGLKGDEIPLQSRIIAIIEAYDAMTSERSYGSALSEESALEEILKNSGIQFDPKLVRIFIEKVLNKKEAKK